ncbi:hypothetical protein V9T40_011393 [Parthenolecanium corni]|uniref:Amidase domain-containing protein n=1 Tax=Parthenolecanium corni TaxID=536013 RepID=A0AAN9T5B3_9HEMI
MESRKQNRSLFCQCLTFFLILLRKLYDLLCDTIFAFIFNSVEVKKVPPIRNSLLRESAVSLAEKIRNQEITSEELVKLCSERIQEVNPITNSVVDTRFEKALEEARAVDEEIRNGTVSLETLKEKKPLLGLPFTMKESVAAEGMRFSCGMICRKDIRASEDAEIVKGLKNAGAILIGMTNVPELNLWIETRNYVYGETNNPYNTNRIAGGSSGGEASMMACCGTPIGFGTDIGGSTRLPAYFCGVYGHKLSGGLVSTKGMTFRTGKEKHTIVSGGGISKYAIDLKPISIAAVLPERLPLLKLDIEVDVSKLNYYYVVEPGDSRVSPIGSEETNALLKVVRSINESSDVKNSPQKVHFAGFKYSYTLWRYWMAKESTDFARDLKNGESKANGLVELAKKLVGQSDHTLAAIIKLIDLHLPYPSSTWAELETENLRNQIVAKLGDNGVLLFPSYPSTAPYHKEPFCRPYNFAYWAIFNVLQLPVTQIPLGLDKNGLPLGIQIVAAPYQDKLCFAVAEHIEKLVGGWVPPFAE